MKKEVVQIDRESVKVLKECIFPNTAKESATRNAALQLSTLSIKISNENR